MNPQDNRCLALAGVLQAAFLVQQLARRGEADPVVLRASLDSVLRLNAASVKEVFAGGAGVSCGLEKLAALQFGRANPATVEAMRYVLLMLVLADHLASDQAAVSALADALTELAARQDETETLRVVQDLADLYVRILSQIKPKIVIHGERNLLQEQRIVDTVRACLLAGVRSAWLWYQLGGRRWHLLFLRGRYIHRAREILDNQSADTV